MKDWDISFPAVLLKDAEAKVSKPTKAETTKKIAEATDINLLLNTEAPRDFFEVEEAAIEELHVQHIMSAQKNLLTMSSRFDKEIEHINFKEKADPNIP